MSSSVNAVLFSQLTEAQQAAALAYVATQDPTAATPAAATPLLVESFADLVAQDFPPQQFLVDGLIPAGQLVMLGGRGKAGKSWLVLQLVAAVDRGILFLGKPTKRGKVLYLALEDGRRRMNQRPKVLRWQPSPAVDISFRVANFDHGGDGLGHIRQAIADKRYDLVVIDTLIKTLSAAADENSNTEMAAICNELADMAHDSGAAIVIVHHTSKVKTENPFDNLRGASAIRNAYDVGLLLRREHNQREATLHVESRDFDVDDMTIKQADNGAGWEYLGDAAVGVALAAGRIGVADLLAAGDGSTTAEIAAAVNKSVQSVRGTMNTAAKHFLVVNKPEKDDTGKKSVDRWYLTLDSQMAANMQREGESSNE
jgi:KaiC/GvpD/RAD55 family RecA-like ATPase